MTTFSASVPPRTTKVRVNFVLHHNVMTELYNNVPSGKRSQTVEHWIEDGIRKLKHEEAYRNILKIREESKNIPSDDPRDSLTILREIRYRNSL